MDTIQQFLDLETDNTKPKIIVDQREPFEFDEQFKILGAIAERRTLEIGDFICSDRVVIERKTRNDFESSVIDGRLFNQLQNLITNYQRVIIIVEGEESARIIGKEALLGAYVSIISDYGAALFFTRDLKKTVELIYAIAKHEQLSKKRPLRIYAKRKTFNLSESQRAIIETFPMLGPKLSKLLLEHFGNIENIVKASERELLEVDGLGRKRAKVIRNVIEKKYKSEEDA